MSIEETLEKTGFERCEFDTNGDVCDSCNRKAEELFFGNRDYWDSREGEYWCMACIKARRRADSEHEV